MITILSSHNFHRKWTTNLCTVVHKGNGTGCRNLGRSRNSVPLCYLHTRTGTSLWHCPPRNQFPDHCKGTRPVYPLQPRHNDSGISENKKTNDLTIICKSSVTFNRLLQAQSCLRDNTRINVHQTFTKQSTFLWNSPFQQTTRIVKRCIESTIDRWVP